MADEVTQYVPAGRAGTSDAFVYDPTPVWQNKRRLDEMANRGAMQQQRLAAQQQILDDRQRAILDRQITKPGDLGFYSTAFEEWDKPWRESYISTKDQREALNQMGRRTGRESTARAANTIVSARLREAERDPEYDAAAFTNALTRNIAERTMQENTSEEGYNPAPVIEKTNKDYKVYKAPVVGSRLLKQNVANNTFEVQFKDGTGYTIKKSDLVDNKGNYDIDKIETVVNADPLGGLIYNGYLEEFKRKGDPNARMSAAKMLFPSLSFSQKLDQRPTPPRAGAKPKQPDYIADMSELEVPVYSRPAGKNAFDKKDFTVTPSKFKGVAFSPEKARVAKITLPSGTKVLYLDNEPVRRENLGGKTYTDRLPSGYSVLPEGVSDFSNIVATVVPVAKRPITINGQEFQALNTIPPDLLPYVSANDVEFRRGVAGTPLVMQQRSGTSTTKGDIMGDRTTVRQSDDLSNPSVPGKQVFIEGNRIPTIMVKLKNIRAKEGKSLDGELEGLENQYKSMLSKSAGAKYFKKPAATKPAQKSAIDFLQNGRG